MGKISRHIITIVITETWTIIWGDAPEVMASSGDAEEGRGVAQVRLPKQPPPEDTRLEMAIPAGEPATSLPDDVFTTRAPGDDTNQSDQPAS